MIYSVNAKESILFMAALVLAYIGSMLIGFEFIRKFKHFQALLTLIIAWPIRSLLNNLPFTKRQHHALKGQKGKKLKSIGVIVYAILLLVLLTPLTALFFLVNLITGLLNILNSLLNLLHKRLIDKYHPFYLQLAQIILVSRRKYADLSAEEVIQKVKETEVPFLPIIGVILITTAFIVQVL